MGLKKLNKFQRFILRKLGLESLYNLLMDNNTQNLLEGSNFYIDQIIKLSNLQIEGIHITIPKDQENPDYTYANCRIVYTCNGETQEQQAVITIDKEV